MCRSGRAGWAVNLHSPPPVFFRVRYLAMLIVTIWIYLHAAAYCDNMDIYPGPPPDTPDPDTPDPDTPDPDTPDPDTPDPDTPDPDPDETSTMQAGKG